MNQQTFRLQWLKSHRAYEKRAYRIFNRTFKQLARGVPFDRLTKANYPFEIDQSIPIKPIYDAYLSTYLQIGLIHGNRIGKGINKDIKEFMPDSFRSELERYLYVWLREQAGNRIVSVRKELVSHITELLAERLIKGQTILEASREITKLVNRSDFYNWQSMRIARTESTTAANMGAVRAGNASGVLWEKVWISATDARVRRHPKSRFDHLAMNGKTVLKGEFFDVDGEWIEYPGALKTKQGNLTSGQNIINCRCAVAVRAKRDRNGRVIRTNQPNQRIPLQSTSPPTPTITTPLKNNDFEGWAKANMNGKVKYIDDITFRFSGRRPEDYGVFKFKLFDENQKKEVQRLINESNLLADKLGIPRLRGFKSNRLGSAASMGDGVMGINKGSFNPISNSKSNPNYNKYLDSIKREYSRTISRGGSPEYFDNHFMDDENKVFETRFWHEFGHHIHQQRGVTTISQYKAHNTPFERIINEFKQDLVNKYQSQMSNAAIRNKIYPSKYAYKNHNEWFAENYTAYKMGRSDLITQEFIDFLKKYNLL